jgi:hypothetical protein
MEWIPIQQADFSPDNFDEYGYVLRLDTSATVVSGGIGVNALPPQVVSNIAEGINIYPSVTALDTGPVRLVTIPVQSGTITGANIGTTQLPSGASASVAQALANPLDNSNVIFFANATTSDVVGLNFGVTAFANELSGKRIVKVRLILSVGSTGLGGLSTMQFALNRRANSTEGFTYQTGVEGVVVAGGPLPLTQATDYSYVDMGDWNPTWGPGITAFIGDTIFPWRYQELANLDTATPINVLQQIQINGDFVTANEIGYIGYAALQIFYCEETRVAYGGRRGVISGIQISTFSTGENRVPIRDTAFASGKTLTPGTYLVTATHRAVSNFFTAKLPPIYAGIRQFNESPPPVTGKIVKPTIVIGDPYDSDDSDVITDISLYTAVAAVTGAHVYASQLQAPVYGTITATQDIVPLSNVVTNTSLAQIRYYARRFGDTSAPLVATIGAVSAGINVTDFDALDEIFDGWREVTLPLTASFPVTGGATFSVVWSATAETNPGNQWQVLGATSFTTSPNVNVATYGAPNGNTAELTWKSPNVTVSTLDTQSDATVILAQNPPSVVNLAVAASSQAVSGIGVDLCGQLSGCIPSAIKYLNLTWNAVSVTGSYFEIQRSDTIDTTWQQVAYVPTSVLTFKDYEARVGVLSSYRIRVCDALSFCGPWVTGSGTVPSPGVTAGNSGIGVLIFTSNRQPNSNLAYTMVWNGQPTEVFVFPEADSQAFQKMYGRDFQVAFRPLERGGEQFERIILVQAAAITLPSLANTRSLRDLAWADLPYVCVRDELGNRWYANVLVPAGEVQRGRRIYLAQIRVTEVSDTPAPVTS